MPAMMEGKHKRSRRGDTKKRTRKMSEHITDKIQEFLDRELPDEERQAVGEHLINCPACREEHDRIRSGMEAANLLASEDAPAYLWARVKADISGRSARSVGLSTHGKLVASFAVAIIAMILFVPFYVYLTAESDPAPAAPLSGWRVEATSGAPSISGLGDESNLRIGGTLETDSKSTARLAVSDIGRVDIAPNSKVKVVRSSEREQRMELERGRMSAEIVAPPRLFIVDTPSAAAVDLGCAYTLDVDDNGNSRLRVTSGYVALEGNDVESFVPAGAFCESRKGKRIGTPFFETASAQLKSALSDLDFAKGGNTAIDIILREAKRKDTLTLWHLIARVPEERRAEIIARIQQLVEPSEKISVEGLMRLDASMLEELKSELMPVWYEQPGWFD